MARLGDGWLASAYNTTPERFREGLGRLAEELVRVGRAPALFPSAIATTWLHITEDRDVAQRTLTEVLAPMLHRPAEALRSAPLLIGPAEVCAERLAAFVAAGARRVFVWPLAERWCSWNCSASASPPSSQGHGNVLYAAAVPAAPCDAEAARKSPDPRLARERIAA